MNRVGQQFGNYRLVRFLGQGGFAEVYLGEHLLMGSLAAIKILNAQLIATESQLFIQEARTLVRLEHPHIVRIKECGIEGGIPFLVMDYAPNGTLRQRHPGGTQVPLEHVVSYVSQVASALQYAHDQNFIHRDVKPENMLVGRNGEVLLSDFGIAVLSATSSIRYAKDSAGTVIYMAPEQIDGWVQRASDQYALGIVVYEWLCGEVPFRGSAGEIIAKHLRTQPPPFREKGVTVSPDVEKIVMKALAKKPEKRFASVQEFALALQQSPQQSHRNRGAGQGEDDGSLRMPGGKASPPFTVNPNVSQPSPSPVAHPAATPRITPALTPGIPSSPLPPTVYSRSTPYAPTQPTSPYTPPRRRGTPCLVATLVSVALLLALAIGAVFVVPQIIASLTATVTTGPGGGSPTGSPTTGPGGGSPRNVPVTLTISPLTLTATNGSSTSDCDYLGPFFGPDSGWNCGIRLQNNGQNIVNWRASGPSEVDFRPNSTGFVEAGGNWTVTVHIPLKDCPGSITFTITPDGGTPQNVVWNCS